MHGGWWGAEGARGMAWWLQGGTPHSALCSSFWLQELLCGLWLVAVGNTRKVFTLPRKAFYTLAHPSHTCMPATISSCPESKGKYLYIYGCHKGPMQLAGAIPYM